MGAGLHIPTWNIHQDTVLSEKSEMQNDGYGMLTFVIKKKKVYVCVSVYYMHKIFLERYKRN